MPAQGNDKTQSVTVPETPVAVNTENETPGSSNQAQKDGTSKDTFNFDSWAKEGNLQRETTCILRSEDLILPDALCLLEDSEIKELGITLGQGKLLRAAINRLQAVPDEGQVNVAIATSKAQPPNKDKITMKDIRSQADTLNAAGGQFDMLLGIHNQQPDASHNGTLNQSVTAGDKHAPQNWTTINSISDTVPHVIDQLHQSNTHGGVSVCDPRTSLTVKADNKKTVHISSFLGEKAKKRIAFRRKDLILTRSGEDSNLVVRSDEPHPYAGITVDEWGAANARLMNHLLQTSQLQRQDIEFYLAYTAIIFDFATNYDWHSVLDFDYTYREQQAQHNFQWGYINPLMELQLLKPRQPHNQQMRGQRYRENLSRTNDGICNNFKRYGECKRPHCNWRHVKQETTTLNSRSAVPLPKNGPVSSTGM